MGEQRKAKAHSQPELLDDLRRDLPGRPYLVVDVGVGGQVQAHVALVRVEGGGPARRGGDRGREEQGDSLHFAGASTLVMEHLYPSSYLKSRGSILDVIVTGACKCKQILTLKT